LSNVIVILETALFPGIVTVVEAGGVLVKLPDLLSTIHITSARVVLVQVKVAGMPVPPLAAFHTNWTLETVTAVCGFVIVMLITGLLIDILIALVVMLPQPVATVGVAVGVNVEVGVTVMVGVADGV
jgi:hypothetical protein